MIDKTTVAIVTSVASFDLYSKTATLFPHDIDKIVINGNTGMYGINSIYYMFEKLKKKKYEWVIMADEDVFFYDSKEIFSLIDYMIMNDYDICGVRDGGVVKHRFHNPEVVNTFFSILNFQKILSKFNLEEVKKCQKFFPELYENKDYSSFEFEHDIKSLKEPYYCFYFWAHLNHFNFLFLNTINPVGDDDTANIILSPTG